MERDKLIGLFRDKATEIAEKDLSHLNEASRLTDLGLDSLRMLELVSAMERELNVQIPDDELVGIQTVKQLVELIEKRTAAR